MTCHNSKICLLIICCKMERRSSDAVKTSIPFFPKLKTSLPQPMMTQTQNYPIIITVKKATQPHPYQGSTFETAFNVGFVINTAKIHLFHNFNCLRSCFYKGLRNGHFFLSYAKLRLKLACLPRFHLTIIKCFKRQFCSFSASLLRPSFTEN